MQKLSDPGTVNRNVHNDACFFKGYRSSGLKKGQTYRVILLSEDGEEVPSGAFIGTGSEPVECNLNAALLRENAIGLVVRSANGEVMLRADLSESAGSPPSGVSTG